MSTITLTLAPSTVTASGGPQVVTASVTNSATVPARIVLGAFGPPGEPEDKPGARAWTQIDRPLRVVAPGSTEQYTVTVNPPAGTAGGEYPVRLIAYDADRPPEEYSDQAQTLPVVVPGGPAPARPSVPWWIWAVAGALVLVVGVASYFLLRPAPPPPPPPPASPTATPSPTPVNPCTSPYVPRLARPGDLVCVTALSAAEAQADNDPDLQRLRKNPSGPYGPDTCVQGYVWREAWDGDVTCVTGAVRTRTRYENAGNPEGTP